MNKVEKLNDLIKQAEELKAEIAREEAENNTGIAYIASDCKFSASGDGNISDIHIIATKYINTGRATKDRATAELIAKYDRLNFVAMKAMKKSWGNEKVDWNNSEQVKYCLNLNGACLSQEVRTSVYQRVAFKTREDLTKFSTSMAYEDLKLIITGVGF